MARPKKARRRKPQTEQEANEFIAEVTRMINAWEKHAPNKKFAGMTLEDFKKAVQPSYDVREELAQLEWKREQLQSLLGEDPVERRRH